MKTFSKIGSLGVLEFFFHNPLRKGGISVRTFRWISGMLGFSRLVVYFEFDQD